MDTGLVMWMGKRLEDMTKEELIAALKFIGGRYIELTTPGAILPLPKSLRTRITTSSPFAEAYKQNRSIKHVSI